MIEPNEVMQLWEDTMKAITAFAGYGDSRPWMEVFPLGEDESSEGKQTLYCTYIVIFCKYAVKPC